MSTSRPLAIVLSATAVALLLAASSSVVSPAAATAVAVGGGRVVFVHGTGGTKVIVGARGSEWRHYLAAAARLEDEVAPELAAILATNSGGGRISAGALDKNRPVCPSSGQCAAKGGGSYTRQCTYKNRCPH